METENRYELEAWSNNQLVLGIDEAGRGPLAGPLVVAGVIFPIGYVNKEIYDSKKLSAKKRLKLFEEIKKDALAYTIKIVDVEEIDRLNIYQATLHATKEIALQLQADVILTDAMPLKEYNNAISLIKGDQKSISIAAGSILAKVTRDQIMDDYGESYPEYGFKQHKGYATAKHLEAIQQYGVLPIHRKSYKPISNYFALKLDL
ncbi:MAG: ribonuclease HII [Erysipelotrichaceae bacterium]|nr:ribonuclease HII [Erysipelotrichaceae bacterium]MDO5085291.1 ribonuclease HII [Erysipelotrichaceae bacterium]